jgi:hypothetical protein
VDLRAVYLEPVFALYDVPPLVVLGVSMERRAIERQGTPFEDGKRAIRIAASLDFSSNLPFEPGW